MATWSNLTAEHPDLTDKVRELFDAHRHKTLATLRRDGSPRISGIETIFALGELWIGSMAESRKGEDLRRDPRFALHSASVDAGDDWPGDAKIAGVARLVTDEDRQRSVVAAMGAHDPRADDEPFDLFELELTEVVTITHGGDPPDHLVITTWHEGTGLASTKRY